MNNKGEHRFTSVFKELTKDDGNIQNIAGKIGATRQSVSSWISGNFTPDIYNLCKIADTYGVSTDYLLGRTSLKNVYKDESALIEDVEKLQSEIKKRSDALQKSLGHARLYAEGIELILHEFGLRKE